MSNIRHELAEEFPEMAGRLHELKTGNNHFARLAEDYHAVNRLVHRAATGLEPVDGLRGTEMRKDRARLKDEIARMLAQA